MGLGSSASAAGLVWTGSRERKRMAAEERNQKILRPSAARLLESMRDIGYSFESALADIVDNSVSAHASRIEIANDIHPETGPICRSWTMGEGCHPMS